MEIVLVHSNDIYINFFTIGMILPVFFSILAIIYTVRNKNKEKNTRLKSLMIWIIPLAFLLELFINTGPYLIDYTFDRVDIQNVYIEDTDRNNAGSNLISGRSKFYVSRSDYIGKENVSDIIDEHVVGHTCEIESYKSSNIVIRIKVLD